LPKGDQQQIHLARQGSWNLVFNEGEACAFDFGEAFDHSRIVLHRLMPRRMS
jgi:hypothetical protein